VRTYGAARPVGTATVGTFLTINRSKRGIMVDLKQPAARSAPRTRLAASYQALRASDGWFTVGANNDKTTGVILRRIG